MSDISPAPVPNLPARSPQLVSQHFGAAEASWNRIANQLKDEIRCLDDDGFRDEKPKLELPIRNNVIATLVAPPPKKVVAPSDAAAPCSV